MSQPPPPPPGQPPEYGGSPQYGTQTDGMAIAALICGIASFIICGAITGIAAVILGTMSRNKIDASGGVLGGRGMATAGLVLGWISIVLTVIVVVVVLAS